MRIFLLIIFLLTPPCFGVQSIENIKKNITKHEVIHAKFTQTKWIPSLADPILVKGELIVWHNKGILWTTHTPFPNQILLTKSGIFQMEEGTKHSILQAHPQREFILTLLSKMISGDFSEINGFEVTLMPSGSEKNWSLKLTPLEGLKNFISSITISGHQFVTQVTIQNAAGGWDKISLSQHSVEKNLPVPLKALFDE